MRSIFLSAMLLSTALLAQGPYMGVKGGINFSNLHGADVQSSNSRFGFNAGLIMRALADRPVGAQVELLYSTRGNRSHYQGFFGLLDQDVDFNLEYIELPALAALRFADNAVEIQAGGYAAYLIHAKVSTSGDLGNGVHELDAGNFNSIDAGLAGGVAFNVGPLQIGLRYDYGLLTIANSDAAKFLLGDAKNSCAQVYIAFGQEVE